MNAVNRVFLAMDFDEVGLWEGAGAEVGADGDNFIKILDTEAQNTEHTFSQKTESHLGEGGDVDGFVKEREGEFGFESLCGKEELTPAEIVRGAASCQKYLFWKMARRTLYCVVILYLLSQDVGIKDPEQLLTANNHIENVYTRNHWEFN